MRVLGPILLAGGLLLAACTSTTSPDEDCITQGGTCFLAGGVCGIPIQADCSSGYSCCATTSINAYNVRDGGFFDAGPPPVVAVEGGTDALPDGPREASKAEAGKSDSGTEDSGTDAAHLDSGAADTGKPGPDSTVMDSGKTMDASDGSKGATMDTGSADTGKTDASG
jgi:hypothetical protein